MIYALGMSQKQRDFATLLRDHKLIFEEEVKGLPGTPDIFFRDKNLAVFFHGCFWHNHGCGVQPTNQITASQRAAQALTDQNQQQALLAQGIAYLIVWECDYDSDPLSQVRKVMNRLHFK